jgi:hypothetical protein
VTTLLSSVFECEARDIIQSLFRQICPWVGEHSEIIGRKLAGATVREADITCYVDEKNSDVCVGNPDNGVYVPPPPPTGYIPPACALVVGKAFSENGIVGGFRPGAPLKYFVGEVYSGERKEIIQEKVASLEGLLEFMRHRAVDRHNMDVTDITKAVGAAALVFHSGTRRRSKAMTRFRKICLEEIGEKNFSHIQRLIAAGRFFIAVLERQQVPTTFSHGAIATALQTIHAERAAAEARFAAMDARLDAMSAQQDARLDDMRARLDAIFSALTVRK